MIQLELEHSTRLESETLDSVGIGTLIDSVGIGTLGEIDSVGIGTLIDSVGIGTLDLVGIRNT